MKHGHAWALGLLALTLSACGGSDHHSSTTATTPTTGPGLTSDYRIEAVLSDTSLDPDYIYEDPLDLQILDAVQFQLVNYPGGSASSRTVAPTVGTTTSAGVVFTTNDALGTVGVLTPGGAFTASSTDSGATRYIVSASYQGEVYSAYYRTNPRLNSARTRGQVVSNGVGVYNAEVDFYGPRNSTSDREVILASVRTGPDGTFRATVPLPSSLAQGDVVDYTFTVRQPTGFGQTFTYSGTDYTTAGTDRPTISLSAGDSNLTDVISLAASNSTSTDLRHVR